MENKVVVHMKGGRIHKGVTHDFGPDREAFHLLPAEGGGVPRRIAVEEMKALFYVKDYIGNRDFVARKHFEEVQRSGHKVILTFRDGEVIYGTVGNDIDDQAGFVFYPVDEKDNNIRIYVVRSSLEEVRRVD